MLRFYSFLLLLVVAAHNCICQSVKDDGPVLIYNGNGKILKTIGGDEFNFYTIIENGKGKGQRYFIEKYGVSDLNRKFSNLLETEGDAQMVESFCPSR